MLDGYDRAFGAEFGRRCAARRRDNRLAAAVGGSSATSRSVRRKLRLRSRSTPRTGPRASASCGSAARTRTSARVLAARLASQLAPGLSAGNCLCRGCRWARRAAAGAGSPGLPARARGRRRRGHVPAQRRRIRAAPAGRPVGPDAERRAGRGAERRRGAEGCGDARTTPRRGRRRLTAWRSTGVWGRSSSRSACHGWTSSARYWAGASMTPSALPERARCSSTRAPDGMSRPAGGSAGPCGKDGPRRATAAWLPRGRRWSAARGRSTSSGAAFSRRAMHSACVSRSRCASNAARSTWCCR